MKSEFASTYKTIMNASLYWAQERLLYKMRVTACYIIAGKINNSYQGTFCRDESTAAALPDSGPEHLSVVGVNIKHGVSLLVQRRSLPVLIDSSHGSHCHWSNSGVNPLHSSLSNFVGLLLFYNSHFSFSFTNRLVEFRFSLELAIRDFLLQK